MSLSAQQQKSCKQSGFINKHENETEYEWLPLEDILGKLLTQTVLFQVEQCYEVSKNINQWSNASYNNHVELKCELGEKSQEWAMEHLIFLHLMVQKLQNHRSDGFVSW